LARRRLYAPVETVLGRVECTLRDRFELALLIKHEGLRRDWGWLKRR
jgi:hypothetical protein